MLLNFFKKKTNNKLKYKDILNHFHNNYKDFIYFEFNYKNTNLYTIIYDLNCSADIENYFESNKQENIQIVKDRYNYILIKYGNDYISLVPKLCIEFQIYTNNYYLEKLTNLLATHNLIDKNLIQKYSYDLYSYLNVHIKQEPIIKKLKEIYKVVHQEKNKIIINSYITCNKFILDPNSGFKDLPEICRCNVHQITFVTNQNNELLEVILDLDKYYHPNVKDQKYCLGSYRHNQLTFELIQSIIDNIKIYNLTNYHSVHKILKDNLLKT